MTSSLTYPRRYTHIFSIVPLLLSLLLSLFLLTTHTAISAVKKTNARHLHLVWSANYGKGEQIFFSSHGEKGWTAPLQISDHNKHLFHATSTIDADGSIWVIWSQAGANGTSLYYSRHSQSVWSKPRKINTGISDNRSATVITSREGTPIIAWSAVKKNYSDIFWARWDGKKWTKPEILHEENNVPDIDPELHRDRTGQVTLTYQTFADGQYVPVAKSFSDITKTMTETKNVRQVKSATLKENLNLPELPPFFTEPTHKATLFIQSDAGSRAIPLDRF